MALVYKVHIQGGSDNLASLPHKHPNNKKKRRRGRENDKVKEEEEEAPL